MEYIRNWAISLCCAAVVGSMFSFLLPKAGTAKIFRFSLHLFFLCCLCLPLLSKEWSLPDSWDYSQDLQRENTVNLTKALQKQVEEDFSKSVQQIIEELLQEEEINFVQARVFVHTEKDNSISISKIKILLDSDAAEQKKRAETLVWERIGIKPDIFLEQTLEETGE